MKSIRVHGSGSDKYENVRLGINGRLDTMQAAILLEKLNIFDDELILRNKIANYYNDNISPSYKKPHVPSGYSSSWAQYSLTTKSSADKENVIMTLQILRFQAWSIIVFLCTFSVFRNLGYKKGDFPCG